MLQRVTGNFDLNLLQREAVGAISSAFVSEIRILHGVRKFPMCPFM